ncbi:hypothetical protein JCM4814A_16620 [Streptomyces phaeofaciens JCM 4814]|uniref:Transmembrane protein n=1 Tax=Streptomyces phaeofaciens TaxID=68254 RepID=A0A918HA14_9ACTN|nr:hypothetical protein [Streptomyces phaeofaciens]GGT48729.1 hypothetical protein GCM10010226_27400 [Streptomyces phaeofaciens]
MTGPPRLCPEDRPDFDAVLRLAMGTAEIRTALSAGPGGRAGDRLRSRALDAADEIAAAAGPEYAAYLAVRAAGRRAAAPRPATGHHTLLPALAVLTPVVAATSATFLLLFGYTLRLADPTAALPGSLVTAGWVLAAVAAVSTLAALLRTAVRERGGPPTPEQVEQARLDWQQALLARGMLPHLNGYVREELPHAPTHTPRTGPPCSD